MRRWSILIAGVVAGALAPRAVAALTFLDLLTGDEAVIPNARTMAMGRVRVGGTGAFSVASNPAYMIREDHKLLAFGGASQRLQEARAIPAYDSFDGFLVESTYVLNNDYTNSGGIGLQGTVGGGDRLALGASYQPVRNHRYAYSEEVRSNEVFTQPRDGLIALNEIRSDGDLRGFTLGVAASPIPWFGAGLSLQFLRGSQDLVRSTQFFDPDSLAASRLELTALSGERAIFGLSLHPGYHIEAAATFKRKAAVTGDYELTGAPGTLGFVGSSTSGGDMGGVTITYPNEAAFGVTFHPRAKMKTTIRAEAGWTGWSSYEHTLFPGAKLSNVWDARVGLEHVFYNGFAARFGFVYLPSPQNTEIVTSSFTFGGGFVKGPLRADLGFEVSNREYRFEDLFPDSDYGGTDRAQKDSVNEDTLGAFLTLSLELDSLRG